MKNNIKPIKPTDVFDEKLKTIPDAMIDAVNKMIALKWNGILASFKREDLVAEYFKKTGIVNNRENRKKLDDENALNFENVYRREGWRVKYYYPQPSNSHFEPFYEFTIKNIKK